ncbi:hypothetical protein [Chryseobacterium jejuense]|nr:hypothetical protein [Chryseobacterium jejuense]
MERFGNIPVNLFTGGLDLQIPIFSSEKNNISLSYNSSGFIPGKKSNYVGYNWSLNYGGAITREVRGIADDFISDGNFNGFLYTVKNNPISNSSAFNNGYNYHLNNNYINIAGRFSELRADKFNFNFFGINGYFYIGNNGKPVVSSSTPNLIVNIDNFSYQDNFYCDPNPSGFSIVDGQGNEYYFGDNTNNVEVSYSLGHHLNPEQPSGVLPEARANYMISGWYLYKVKFANGEFLNINYKSRPLYFDASDFCIKNNYLPIKKNFGLSGSASNTQPYYELYLNVNQKNSTETTIYNGGSGFPFYQELPHYSIEVVKKVFPESIEIPDRFFIKFIYKTQQANVAENFDAYLLEFIEVKNKSQNTSNVDKFELRYNTSNKDYYFLTEIIKNTDQKHLFNYNLNTTFPKFNTFGTDYWGFWNGANATQNALIPNYQLNFSTGDITITGTSRASSNSLFDVALLNKVTYPTGGYSLFDYEPNSYAQKVTKNSSTNFIKQLVPNNDIAGGARIKKISSFDGNNTITKEYRYIKDFSSGNINGPSTGILYNDYRMVNFVDLNAGSSNSRTISEEATNINTTSLSSYHIGYSEVSELENNELKKKYFFSDYASNPDSLVYSQGPQVRFPPGVNVNPANYQQRYFLRYLDNKDNERGKLIREVFYKDGNNIVQENFNIYSSLKSHKLLSNNYVTLIETAVAWRMFYKFYGLPYVLKKSITKKYFGSSVVEEKSTNYFEGNLHLNLTKVIKEYSDNTEFKTTYLYAEDLRHGNQPQQNYPPYFSLPYMIGNNIVGVPLVTSNYKNNIFQNRTQTVYEHNPNNNLDLPKRSLYYTEDAMVAAPLDNGFGVTMVPGAFERFNEVVYDQYDSKENLVQYTTKDGISTVIIWGYNGTQPIAKIENAKLENIGQSLIDSIVNASNTDAAAERNNDETNLLNAFNTFKKDLGGYQITTYSYDPLIGVRSITPPSGIREVYLYDTAGRLKEVRENNQTGKLLKEFKYNYKQ